MSLAIEGAAAVVAGIIVFCGSIWLLLSMITGRTVAYFVTASVTLGFVLILSLVWSFTQLGPVGELPSFKGVEVADDPDQLSFAGASSYPQEWQAPQEDDQQATEQVTELENSAAEYFNSQVERGKFEPFTDSQGQTVDAQVVTGSGRLMASEGETYGAVMLQPTGTEVEQGELPDPQDPNVAVAVMRYDPGNPYGQARTIALGVAVLLVVHLFGLSRAERRQQLAREATG